MEALFICYLNFLLLLVLIYGWPTLVVLTDVMGHSPDVFCSFCVFLKANGSACTTISYTNNLHWKRMEFMSFVARMDIVQTTCILTQPLLKQLLQNINTRLKEFAKFTEMLSTHIYRHNHQSIQKSSWGGRSNVCRFDPFRSELVVPDHLPKCLMKYVLMFAW